MKNASVVLVLLAAVVGCGSTASIADENAAGPGKFAADAGAAKETGARPPAQSFCAGSGGIVLPGTTQCTGDIAKKLFRFGLCSCTGIATNGSVQTSSFDSSTHETKKTGGSIGTNGDFRVNGDTDIGGSVFTPTVTSFNGGGRIAQELRSGAGAASNGPLTVGGDYYGSVASGPSITVAGAQHVPVAVAPPCDCAEQVPIAAYVSAFAKDNDDAAAGLTPQSFGRGTESQDVTLACGRYYFDEISPNGALTLRLQGRTAIFVGGDAATNGGLSFVFEKGAELDLFVDGNLIANGGAAFGNVDAPAHARIYVAGPQVSVNGDAAIAANLYAPNAAVALNGGQKTRGSVYAKAVEINGPLDLEYDEAILGIQGCEAPGGSCQTCGDCSGSTPACSGGKCAACKTNADCCAPLMCAADGSCIASVR